MAMVKDQLFGKTMRKSYAKYQEILEMPNLLKIQKDSYQWFLNEGLQEVFRDVGTITDFSGKLELSFLDFTMKDAPKYTVEECVERDATYARPIKVRVRLRNTETDEIKEQEIFMGDFPIMTNGGTFVINGGERVIVSQIVRSPGMYYGHEVDKADQHTYTTTVIPYRGAWLEYETDNQGVFYVRIDKNRKLPITCLIRALGVDTDDKIRELFGDDPLIRATIEKDVCKTREESLLEIYRRLRPGEPPTVENAEAYMDALFFDARRYDVSKVGRYKFNKKMDIWSRLSGQTLAEPVADPMTGEILAMPGETLTRARAQELSARGGQSGPFGPGGRPDSEGLLQRHGGYGPVRLLRSQGVRNSREGSLLRPAGNAGHRSRGRLGRGHRPAAGRPDPQAYHHRRHSGLHQLSVLRGRRRRRHRRHRPSGQPPPALRRRAASESAPGGLYPAGAGDSGADDRPGPGRRHAPEPHQHPAGHCGHPGVLRLVSPVPVHGPEQSPGRADPQAPRLRPGPRRSEPGAGLLRRPGRALQPLRPDVPHRDPEGPNIGLINYLASYAQVNEYGFVEAPSGRWTRRPASSRTPCSI